MSLEQREQSRYMTSRTTPSEKSTAEIKVLEYNFRAVLLSNWQEIAFAMSRWLNKLEAITYTFTLAKTACHIW